MAEFLPPVIFEIKAKATEAIASMREVNLELDKMEAKSIAAGGSLSRMNRASKYAGTALLGIAGVLGVVGVVSVKAAIEVGQAQAKLKMAVENTGVSFEAFEPYMENAVENMAKLNFTAGDTIQALTEITTATRNPQTAIQNLAVVADLAAYKNMSLADAGNIVAKAAMGQVRGLATLGLALGKTIPKGASLAVITKMIEDRIHGAAKAAADADPWKQLTVQFGLMEEKIGVKLLPAFKHLTVWITEKAIPGLEKLGQWISDNKGLFETFVATLALIWAVPKIAGLITAINVIKNAFIALRDVLIAVDIAEALATGGTSVAAGMAAIAVAAATYASLGVIFPNDPSAVTGGQLPQSFQPSGTGANYKVRGLPPIPTKYTPPSINSGLKPQMITTPPKAPKPKSSASHKQSLAQQMKGTTGLGTGIPIINVYVDGAKSGAKVATQGAPLSSGGKKK
jgi:hypothetical protein